MKPEYTAGRIHRDEFIISTSCLLGMVALAVTARFLIQIRVGKKFALDDAFLMFGLASLIAALIVFYIKVHEPMYLLYALMAQTPGATPIPLHEIPRLSDELRKHVTITLILCWCTIMAVKFSFLFFFKKLVDRIYSMYVYWWVIIVYNIGFMGYGAAVYYLACPYEGGDRRACGCTSTRKGLLVKHATAQMTLDVIGDLMILAIPIAIIWRVKIRWSQRIVLAFSLYLTFLLIIITIIRISGLIHNNIVDQVWEIYWTLLSAEVGIIMASAISFRAFFVPRSNAKSRLSPQEQVHGFFRESYLARKYRMRHWNTSAWDEQKEAENGLPHIPRAHITGIRTFIDHQGRSFSDDMGVVFGA
ncbi:hypothetical protein BCR34DRAFT_628782 [Clohesyomyces aquaticus]|uniref:Rhodopsin domain-containing protein n=1 Tax=Clohesyomyces aquaticus TaxID=1231657 RepID=A0A1Y1YFG4_9PLEO|nr:hypothetical protein BCR34DRAFT_628782 [Clohesyomyces aquaticus]